MRLRNTAAAAALIVATTCGSALAASPADPPGKSGEAPGHQPHGEPPGQAKKQGDAPIVEAPVTVEAPAAQQAENAAPVESPRFENAAGKPKHNVPAAAEAAPESSVSAPGNSGRHKLTICHKGHAITVDVHAARAHVDGHGDTYAAAGAKGRAACPQSSPPTPPRPVPPGDPGDPGDPETPTGDPKAPPHATAPTTPTKPVAPVEPAASPTKKPTSGVSATVREVRGGAVASTVAGDTLPFTGAPLRTLVLFGLGLVAVGVALVLGFRTPASARRR
jgi:hypothetical protein